MTEMRKLEGGDALRAVAELEGAYVDLWDAVRPKPGETWTKHPCEGICLIGWSHGVGTYVIADDNNDWGYPHHLVCGCLERLK